MALANPKKAWWYATVCTVASVAGGVAGYAIGYLFYETVGLWLVQIYGYANKVEALRAFYDGWGWAFILVAGFTPMPYKLVTIFSGMLEYNLALFILLSTITRGARFFLVAAVLNRFGDTIRSLLDRHFVIFLTLVVFFIIAGFFVVSRLF
jgi:membrane protein YqaA with SNARE-associated domain